MSGTLGTVRRQITLYQDCPTSIQPYPPFRLFPNGLASATCVLALSGLCYNYDVSTLTIWHPVLPSRADSVGPPISGPFTAPGRRRHMHHGRPRLAPHCIRHENEAAMFWVTLLITIGYPSSLIDHTSTLEASVSDLIAPGNFKARKALPWDALLVIFFAISRRPAISNQLLRFCLF